MAHFLLNSWVVTLIGLVGFHLAGQKVWWAWYVNIGNQMIWLGFALYTRQWGFLVGVVFYLVVFTRNAIRWTREHRAGQRLNVFAGRGGRLEPMNGYQIIGIGWVWDETKHLFVAHCIECGVEALNIEHPRQPFYHYHQINLVP